MYTYSDNKNNNNNNNDNNNDEDDNNNNNNNNKKRFFIKYKIPCRPSLFHVKKFVNDFREKAETFFLFLQSSVH